MSYKHGRIQTWYRHQYNIVYYSILMVNKCCVPVYGQIINLWRRVYIWLRLRYFTFYENGYEIVSLKRDHTDTAKIYQKWISYLKVSIFLASDKRWVSPGTTRRHTTLLLNNYGFAGCYHITIDTRRICLHFKWHSKHITLSLRVTCSWNCFICQASASYGTYNQICMSVDL